MGQRHQVFVLAQVIPQGTPVNPLRRGYRCIVALHHQWCYGRLPLRATRRFLTLLRVPENAEIVRWELDKIRDDWESLEDNDNPCPYTASLLLSCWSASLDLQKPYSTGRACYLLSPSTGSGDVDNNDGITVIDITDCQSPAYCFVSVGGLDSDIQVPSWKPLTAKQYCRAYYPRPDRCLTHYSYSEEDDIVSVIASLDNETVLDYSVLADTWPIEYRVKASSAFPAHEVLAHEPPTLIPSLVDFSIEPSIASIIQGGDSSLMRNVMAQPDKRSFVRSKLQELPSFPDKAMPLLLDLLELELELTPKLLDLTYLSLQTAQILQLMASFESIEVLNLSHNHLVGIKTVEQILLKPLRRVVLLSCSSFNDEDVASLLSDKPELFQSIDAFIHPYFFSPHPDAPIAFAIASTGPNPYWVSVSYISPSRVVETLIDIITALFKDKDILCTHAMAAGISCWRRDAQSWDERSVVTVPTLQHCPNKGWTFIISDDRDRGYDSPRYKWAFVDLSESATVGSNPGSPNINEEDSQPAESTHGAERAFSSTAYTVYGLRAFLKRFSLGQIPVPEDDIRHLEQLMIDADEILQTQREKGLWSPRQMFKGTKIFEQMTSEDVVEFIRKDDPQRPIC